MTFSQPVHTASLFRPLHQELVRLLRSLEPADWDRPTVAGQWTVKDVAAHLLDGQCRRLSFQRDGLPMPDPPGPISSRDGLVAFLDGLNAEWVTAFRRVSPSLLTGMLAVVGPQVAAFFESLDPRGEAFFAVDWAGEGRSANWMDIGRDYTELWHHQAQIRMATGRDLLLDDAWMTPLHRLAVLALPPSLASLDPPRGASLTVEIQGPGAGTWTLSHDEEGWTFGAAAAAGPRTVVRMDGRTAWRIFFNAAAPGEARGLVTAHGDDAIIHRVLRTRSVMVRDV
ncbi:MAG TPA: maleylpyruvate isomerase N-terminal domain-containing protein [Longimicrobiales bacterium]|nr:maleylpyruvate isomerase N-terminal domain-containing protein [Longimicrobiales bacterium]